MPSNVITRLDICKSVFERYAFTKKIIHSNKLWRKLDLLDKYAVLISHSDSLANLAAITKLENRKWE